MHTDNTVRRFNKFINKTQKCWLWTGNKKPTGYGLINVSGKTYRAHRLSYEIFVGPIGKGLEVCHSCDNSSCVNPAHLWIGTHKENMQDMTDKGRTLIGSKNGRSVLKEVQVLKIRELANSTSVKQLSKRFGVSNSMIRAIISRERWKHI